METREEKEQRQPLVEQEQEHQITRLILIWLNTCPLLPVQSIGYEDFQPDCECITMTLIQGTRILEKNIIGGYTAEYKFLLLYRIKPGESVDRRIKADETLEKIAKWLCDNPPDLGRFKVRQIEPTERAEVIASYDDGDEDHQITIAVQYYVPPEL